VNWQKISEKANPVPVRYVFQAIVWLLEAQTMFHGQTNTANTTDVDRTIKDAADLFLMCKTTNGHRQTIVHLCGVCARAVLNRGFLLSGQIRIIETIIWPNTNRIRIVALNSEAISLSFIITIAVHHHCYLFRPSFIILTRH